MNIPSNLKLSLVLQMLVSPDTDARESGQDEMLTTPPQCPKRYGRALTPETVPKFVIPRYDGPEHFILRDRADRLSPYMYEKGKLYPYAASASEDVCSDRSCASSPAESPLSTGDRETRHLRTDTSQGSPSSSRPTSTDEYSDSDPGFKLSMTLRHFPRKVTTYGFSTLSSYPSTTRKESLYFRRGARTLHQPKLSLSTDLEGSSSLQMSDSSADSPLSLSPIFPRYHSAKENRNGFVVSTGLSEEDSGHDSPANRRKYARDAVRVRANSWAKAPRKRRMAVWVPKQTKHVDPDVGYSSDQSSPESSPKFSKPRKTKGSAGRKCKTRQYSQENNRSLALQQLHLACGRQLKSVDLGELEVALRYDAPAKRLLVVLIRGKNIGLMGGLSPNQVSSCVKLSLKQHTQTKCRVQRSEVVKNTCDPFYDEEFAFENVSYSDIRNSDLRLKVCRERRAMHSVNFGEVWVKLAQLERNGYEHVQEDLKPKGHFTCMGLKEINIGLSYRASNRNLTVVVVEARSKLSHNWRKFVDRDCRVEVELTQISRDGSGLDTQTKCTQFQRGLSASPVFKEAFTFRLNETQNIRDGLTLVCRVVRKEPFRKGTLIGQVRFGVGSAQKSASDQWTTLLRRLGRPVTQWHSLVGA